MSDNFDKVIASASFIIIYKLLQRNKKRNERRWWHTTLFKNREVYSGNNLLNDLEAEDSGKFRNFSRMSAKDFNILLGLIEPRIMKSDTNYRLSISARERLAITLRFLATGDSYGSLQYLFKVSKQSISAIVPEVCDAIIESLKDYVKLPKSEEEWLNVAQEFEDTWNFPHCCGSVDGKHVVLQAPFKTGSDYYNYKSTFSIVLMALVDADYCFQYVDIGCQGRISDGGVFRNTKLYKKLQENSLKLPSSDVLKGREKSVPYIIVADDAFPMQKHILKPYAGIHPKGSLERIFNYRLSRSRRIVENAFGILSAIFRVLRRPMLLEPENAEKIVLACVYLHNFLRKSKFSRNIYTPTGIFDLEKDGSVIDGAWRQDNQDQTSFLPLQRVARKSSTAALDIRQEFAEYFITDIGRVPWQNTYA